MDYEYTDLCIGGPLGGRHRRLPAEKDTFEMFVTPALALPTTYGVADTVSIEARRHRYIRYPIPLKDVVAFVWVHAKLLEEKLNVSVKDVILRELLVNYNPVLSDLS